MIEIVMLEDSPVSDSFSGEVERAIQAVPECISVLLVQHRYKVVISRLLTGDRPGLTTTKPGMGSGKTECHNCPNFLLLPLTFASKSWPI